MGLPTLGAAAGLALVTLVIGPAAADAAPLPEKAKVKRSAQTGDVRFIGTAAGDPIARPAGFSAGSDPAAVGRAFLQEHAAEFGLAQASALRVERTERRRNGAVVRYQQVIDGVPVLGGQFVVQLDGVNRIRSTMGEAEPNASVDTSAKLTSAEAERRAIARIARGKGVARSRLKAGQTALAIFDPRIVGGPGVPRPRLVWSVDVGDGGVIRERVFIDADLGVLVATFDETQEAMDREVCDNENDGTRDYPCTTPDRSEGEAATGIADIDKAYDYAGATYDFFETRHGRDSLDDAGMTLKSTVRYCPSTFACPYQNAFWDGEQMVYGDGFASADDVVGHELVHGITEHTANLFYYYQSGAISESMSDVFGEFIDLTTASPNDTAGDRWKIGESLSIGAIRDMSDPPASGDPDRMLSPIYRTGEADGGGVHSNSGVSNKAAYLLVDGATFNGETVTGVGLAKTSAIYYEVLTGFLTSGSDYADLGDALIQACTNLVGGSEGIATADCTEVADAVAATQMLTGRPEAVDMPECATTQTAAYVYDDDLEGAKNFTEDSFDSTSHWEWFFDFGEWPGIYASSGDVNWWGYNKDVIGLYSITQNAAVTVPPGGFLRFRHAYSFERWDGETYDGGVVEYSTNNGSTWQDAIGSVSTIYPGTVDDRYGNPLRGRKAFVGVSHGYVTTVVPLTSLAGQNVRFRFRIGTDETHDDYGWWLDDIAIGACGTPGSFSIDSSSAADEGSGADQIVVRRTGSGFAQVNVAPNSSGSATPGADFTAFSTSVTFTGSETTKTVPLSIIDDSAVEGSETIGVALSNPANGSIPTPAGTVTLVDNDSSGSTSDGSTSDGTSSSGSTTSSGDTTSSGTTTTTGGVTTGGVTAGALSTAAAPVAALARLRAGSSAKSAVFAMVLAKPGRVTITGKVKGKRLRASRRFARAGAATVRVPLKAVYRLRRKRALKVNFTITFRPAEGGRPVVTQKTVKLTKIR